MYENDPEDYVDHLLNTSPTKHSFSFTKSNRFDNSRRKSSNDLFYQLPSTMGKRSCSFGYGKKTDFTNNKKVLPPPGSYQLPSDFTPDRTRYQTVSFSPGRNQIKFGYFLSSAERLKTLPSPNAYNIKQTPYSTKGGKMAAKLPSYIDMAQKNKVPGPGSYQLDATFMKNSGSFILSRYRNQLSPKYLSPKETYRSRSKSPDPGQYDVNIEKPLISKFKNTMASSFGKEKRPQMADKTKRNIPSFKYKIFSQFGYVGKKKAADKK